MNNYPNYQNYNYLNNYNQSNFKSKNFNEQENAYINKQQLKLNQQNNIDNLYGPYQGFIRGNMFEKLYDPYKLKTPYDIRPMNEQAELLTSIDSLSFACIDLNLYLDIYPNDKNIIDLFNQYRIQKKELMEEYENKFGPLLLNSDSLNSYPWAWDNKPWPWETN